MCNGDSYIRNSWSTSEGPLSYPYNTIENKDSLPVKARSKEEVRNTAVRLHWGPIKCRTNSRRWPMVFILFMYGLDLICAVPLPGSWLVIILKQDLIKIPAKPINCLVSFRSAVASMRSSLCVKDYRHGKLSYIQRAQIAQKLLSTICIHLSCDYFKSLQKLKNSSWDNS